MSSGIYASIIEWMKTIFMSLFVYYTNFKITNEKITFSVRQVLKLLLIIVSAIVCQTIKNEVGYLISLIWTIILTSLIYSTYNAGNSMIITIISLGINYVINIITIVLTFLLCKTIKINSDFYILGIIEGIHILILHIIFNIQKFKKGFIFLQNKEVSEGLDFFILNISIIVLVCVVFIIETSIRSAQNYTVLLVIFPAVMLIFIQKSLQLYYKQKLLVQELEQTKKDLADKTKEIEILEKENIAISKRNHTIDHKQKALELKMTEMMNKSEISKEEVAEVRERLKQISKDINREKIATELDKTEISEIDDMLKYMQTECNKNKIEFELQIKGNIHYMTNNLISKEDLETLLADHIKNAIIAIEHTNSINRSVLVRLGKIDENYGLYIYDSGIEFEQETLKNLGKIPITTHANEGGTGMGFMNTFDTLNKCKASLIIEEFNKPSKDNYTKALFIKFDNKNEFKIKSYR